MPSSPGRPVIELSTQRIQPAQPDENSVTDEINLAWDVPDDDGGYPITGKNGHRFAKHILNLIC